MQVEINKYKKATHLITFTTNSLGEKEYKNIWSEEQHCASIYSRNVLHKCGANILREHINDDNGLKILT